MTKHFLRDLDSLRRAVLLNGRAVETAFEKAIAALMNGGRELAAEVIEGDAAIDEREIEIEVECLKILALHQPVAHDLRFLVAVLKVNNDLERIGDLSKNLAKNAIRMAEIDADPVPVGFHEMSRRTRAMVRDSLDALIEPNIETARAVLAADDAVDALEAELIQQLLETMRADPSRIEASVCLLDVARGMERIADMATNIAEDIVFLVEGELIRHAYRHEDQAPRLDRARAPRC